MRTLIFIILFSPLTLWANLNLAELQTAYKDKNYQTILAHAQLYRMSSSTDINEYDNVLALEIITLSRLCQWPIIESLIISERNKSDWPKLKLTQKALAQLNLKNLYNFYGVDQKIIKLSKVQKFKVARDNWIINLSQAKKFTSLKNLRLNMESKCKN